MLALAVAACAPGGSAPTPAAQDDLLVEVAASDSADFLSDLAGKPVVFNLWASWCPPCRDEAPTLAAAAVRYDGRVHFVGVNYQDSPEDARQFMSVFNLPFKSLRDPTGELSASLGLRGIPVTVVLDARGDEVFRRVGAVAEPELVAAVEAALSN